MIFKNPLKADFVVLSSCESGLGRALSGKDMYGLQRSFFLGGVKGILSTLWKIDDSAIREFMKEFYLQSKTSDYLQAYQKARQHLYKQGYSPAIYGAFILSGTH